MLTRLIYTDESGYSVEKIEIPVVSGKITVTLPKFSAMVLRNVAYEEDEENNL